MGSMSRCYASAPKPASVPMRQLSETFIDGTSANYVEEMFAQWQKDPSSVHASWASYFKNVESGAPLGSGFAVPPTIASPSLFPTPSGVPQGVPVQTGVPNEQILLDHMKLMLLIRAYQVRGHVLAKIDPLELMTRERPPELQIETYGFATADLDREFFLSGKLLSGILSGSKAKRTLREIIAIMEQTYCGSIGVEYMHIQDRFRANWIRERFETDDKYKLPKDEKINLLDRLAWATLFEQFLQKKYTTAKRFGLDGGEVMIPGMKELIDHAADLGVSNVVIGMAHRGRLNVLANVVRKPLAQIFHEFDHGSSAPEEEWGATGDVKYHLGTSYDRPTRSGKKVHLSLLANPSHLEAVNPVVEGKARAKQYYLGDADGSKVMTIQIHGDASVAGQGVVFETINLSGLPHNSTGGTVHIVINNQVGFTTDPRMSRGGMYCTDVMKSTGAPVFHVNADDPEAVIQVCRLAVEWRQTFKKDVVIDLVCYRRYGHNEIDLPWFTQPLMYKKIDVTPTVLSKYSQQLLAEGVLTQADLDAIVQRCMATYAQGHEESKTYHSKASDWLESVWKGFKSPAQLARIKSTGVPVEVLKHVGKALYSLPEGFTAHNTILRLLAQKQQMIDTGKGIDWGTAEALAFGSLLMEGNHVRIAGQDVERGTFSHRHAVIVDQNTGARHCFLNNIPGQKEKATIVNSALSEFAELGFELGYSLENPNALVIWEAQFGDFVNGAQIIIDQFISSGEQKWFRQSGLVMLLPHGYEGAGPEHSSCRMERFLQNSDQDLDVFPALDDEQMVQRNNWTVANCSTPANYFHILRRQIHREFRKPLIHISPKSLLKHRLCKSDIEVFDDTGADTRFQPVIGEQSTELAAPEKIKRVVFCSGKIYYELLDERDKRKIADIAIVRVEQLAPFPFHSVAAELSKYSNAEVVWCQEEPKNMGSWFYTSQTLRTALRKVRNIAEPSVKYAGRGPSASPAVASHERHEAEQRAVVNDALSL